jgi:hypothetical protein
MMLSQQALARRCGSQNSLKERVFVSQFMSVAGIATASMLFETLTTTGA